MQLCKAVALASLSFLGWSGVPTPLGGFSDPLPSLQGQLLEVGEELEYKVSYSFFNIGTIRTQVLGKEARDGRTVYRLRALIDSNPSLSWLVDLHIQFVSEMDGSAYSLFWLGEDSSKKEISFRRFHFDYENNQAFLERGKRLATGERKVESVDTVSITDRCQDGLTLLFYAREHVHDVGQQKITTLVEDKQVYTYINFTNRRDEAEVDAVDYPVDVVAFDGKADYVGIFGLTGGFRGWFSNDTHRVPILARMNVILGSVKIQLARWSRPGWQPPKYVEASSR